MCYTFSSVASLSPERLHHGRKPLPCPTWRYLSPKMRAQKLLNFLEMKDKTENQGKRSHWMRACPRTSASAETDHGSISMPGTSLTQFHFVQCNQGAIVVPTQRIYVIELRVNHCRCTDPNPNPNPGRGRDLK